MRCLLKSECLVMPDERVAAAACGSLANIAACKSDPEDHPTVKQVLRQHRASDGCAICNPSHRPSADHALAGIVSADAIKEAIHEHALAGQGTLRSLTCVINDVWPYH